MPLGVPIIWREPTDHMYEAVSIVCDIPGSAPIKKAGFKLGNYVLTFGNFYLSKTSKISDVTITFEINNHVISLCPSFCRQILITELAIALSTNLSNPNLCSEFFENFSPAFDDLQSCNFAKLLIFGFGNNEGSFVSLPLPDSYDDSIRNHEIGDEIIVSYTPLGIINLLNTLAHGIVSSFCCSPHVFITDANVTDGASGAPIYRKNNGTSPSAILVTQLYKKNPSNDSNEFDITPMGLSIGINISVLYNSLRDITICESDLERILKKKLAESAPVHLTFKSSSLASQSLKFQERKPAFLDGEERIDVEFLCNIMFGANRGSGIVISDDGLILTCAHVVECAIDRKLSVLINGHLFEGHVIYITDNKLMDLALILLYVPRGIKLMPCTLTAEPPQLGETIYGLGHTYFMVDDYQFLSKGVVVSFNRKVLRTSAHIVQGCSGGAMLRPNGEMIGLISRLFHVSNKFILSESLPIYTIYFDLMNFIKYRDMKYLTQMETKYLMIKQSKY